MPIWSQLIVLGDSALTIPLGLAIALLLVFQGAIRQAISWVLGFGSAILLIVAGKLAFTFFGWSIPAIDMYVVSGHAMLAVAVYPVLLGTLANNAPRPVRRAAISAGVALAGAIAVALIVELQHTSAETLLGSGVGFLAAYCGLRRHTPMRHGTVTILVLLPLLCLILLNVSLPVHATRHGVWQFVGNYLRISDTYLRYIAIDPQTGKPHIILVPIRR